MQNQMILTPFFLDEPLPGLESLAASDWLINKPHLPAGEMQQRHGVPRNSEGDESTFVIIAMGKLGGGEMLFRSPHGKNRAGARRYGVTG